MVRQIAGYREFPAVKRGISQPGNSILGGQFERDKVAARTAHNNFGIYDSHLAPVVGS